MKILVLLTLLVALVKAEPILRSIKGALDNEWKAFKIKFEKNYTSLDELSRRLVWERNVKFIKEHNRRYDFGEHTYFLGVNQFADMTNEEFVAKYLGLGESKRQNVTMTFMAPLNIDKLPKTVNWVKKGYVTPVKNQGLTCGSCYAFSATGAIEGQYFRKYKKLVSFSEQQLVDCSFDFGNNKCHGGLITYAFNYAQRYGMEKEEDYKYISTEQPCKFETSKVVGKISGHANIDMGNEAELAVAVATQGPISVGIDASQLSFQHYGGGVYNHPNCSEYCLNHAVLIVGYGVSDGQNYWLVKNSWGTRWGMNGYFKMAKDNRNQCGIATAASYPII